VGSFQDVDLYASAERKVSHQLTLRELPRARMICAEKLVLEVSGPGVGVRRLPNPSTPLRSARPRPLPPPRTGRDLWCPLVAALSFPRGALARSLDFWFYLGSPQCTSPCAFTHGILFLLSYVKSGYLKSFPSSEVRNNKQKTKQNKTRIWSSRRRDPSSLRTPRSSKLRLPCPESSCSVLKNRSLQLLVYNF